MKFSLLRVVLLIGILALPNSSAAGEISQEERLLSEAKEQWKPAARRMTEP